MKKIILFIIVGTFLISTIGFQVTSNIIDPINGPPIPGDMAGDELDLVADYYIDFPVNHHDIAISYDENVFSLIEQLDETLYMDYLEGLVSFGPRVTSTDACDDAGDYIYNEFVSMGLDTRKQYWESDEIYGNNIEATIHGIDENSDEIYIICGHYDSVPGSPGADDDASGVAAAMAAANIMKDYLFNHTIRFVAFSGEEQGLYGSYFYAHEAVDNGDNIVAVLNADMIGFAITEDDASWIRVFEDEYSEWITDYTIDVSQAYEEIINIDVIPSGHTWGSDHYRFWEVGYNAIFYHEYNFCDYYHTSGDTIEHMNIDYATRASRLIVATLAEFSQIQILEAPYKPNPPDGTPNGEVGIEYAYTAVTTDPQNDQVEYLFDWDDGTDSGWLGPYNSGDLCQSTHIWSEKDSYNIKVKARDIYGHESEWSDPLPIKIPHEDQQQESLLIRILQLILNIFPSLEPILGPILANLMD